MRILFIPHVPNTKVINRVYEFAKNSNSIFLTWEIDNSNITSKISSQLVSLFQKISLNDNILRIPLLFRPEKLAPIINTAILNYAIKKYNIDTVVNANAMLFTLKKINANVFYDLVDDHLEINYSIGLNESRIKKIKDDIQASIGIICVSEVLSEKVQKLHQNIITIENGLYLERFNNAKSLKKALKLDGKKVYGYIGGVDEWTGIEKACEAYLKIKNSDNAMIIVGEDNSRFFHNLKNRFKKDIHFIGQVPPNKVGNYFKTLDIGLIPFELNEFTHNAFPIKAFEYALAGANVVSTPLRVLQKKRLPFIDFYPIEKFAKAMEDIQKRNFQYDFSQLCWKNQTNKLLKFIKENIK